MRVSAKSRYALEALTYMCGADGNTQNIKVLSEKVKVNEKYLEQIFFVLRKAGILDTKRGPAGGYFIAADTAKLTAGDVVRASQGELEPVSCLKADGSCDRDLLDSCVTRYLWSRMTCAMSGVLDSVTLDMLSESYREMSAEEQQ